MAGMQQSVTGVLPHPFNTQRSLHKFWVANHSIAPTSATSFVTVAAGLRLARANMWTQSKALLASKDMEGRQHSATGVLPHPFPT